MTMIRATSPLVSCLLLAAGCTDHTLTAVPPRPSGEQRQEIPVSTNRDIDILFVVDNSDSMAQEQDSLARNFPEFVRVLESIGDLPDLHLGVISSDVGTAPYPVLQCEGEGDDGLLQVPPACDPLTDGNRYIVSRPDPDAPGGRAVNYTTETMALQFGCMARLGVGGCGFEQHFESLRRALDNRVDNGDFLRDDAFLAVIFIQDEDDCSAHDRAVFDANDPALGPLGSYRCFEYGVRCEPDDPREPGPREDCAPRDDSDYIEDVQAYVDHLRSLKDDPSRVIVAGISGAAAPVSVEIDQSKTPPELATVPVCTVCPGGGSTCSLDPDDEGAALVSARPAVRLRALLDAFPQKSTFQDICAYDPAEGDVDLSGALVQIAALLRRALGTPCIAGALADGDPAEEGIQPVCSVSDIMHIRQPDQEENLLDACRGPLSCDADVPDPPCYRFESNEACGTETDLAITIDRCDPAPPDTTVVVRCLVE